MLPNEPERLLSVLRVIKLRIPLEQHFVCDAVIARKHSEMLEQIHQSSRNPNVKIA